MARADPDDTAADETVRLIRAEGGHGETILADVGDAARCADLVRDAAQLLDGLSGTTVEDWDRTVRGERTGALPDRRRRSADPAAPLVDRLRQLRG